jgi:hypothetical protein
MNDLTVQQPREVAQQQPVNALELIRELILDERVKPERIAALMDLQERAEAKEAERQFNVDFAAAMSEMPTIIKDKIKDMGGKGSIPYASYENVDKIVRRVELKYGFCRTFSTERTEKACSLMTVTLLHKGGHSIKSTRYQSPDPGPGRNDAQAQGSSDSYNKRYLTLGIWNIVTAGVDDDGERTGAISQEQSDDINSLISEIGMTAAGRAAFFALADVRSVEEIPQRRYKDIMQALQSKRAARK